jgi:hypothetical protein
MAHYLLTLNPNNKTNIKSNQEDLFLLTDAGLELSE